MIKSSKDYQTIEDQIYLHKTRLLKSIGVINNRNVVLKVGMVGDSQIGKTSLMVKYVEGSFDEDYIQTLGKKD